MATAQKHIFAHHTTNHRYRITVWGHLDAHWSGWLEDMEIAPQPSGLTEITGSFVDQAALFGLLLKIRDLGLPLHSVRCLDEDA